MFKRKLKKTVVAHIVDEFISLGVIELRDQGIGSTISNFTKLPLNSKDIGEFVKNNELNGLPVSLVLGGKQIVTRTINITDLPKEEIRKVLEWEITKYIPISPEELIYDFEILGSIDNPEGKQLRIMIIAARKEYVEEHCEVLAQEGLKPKLVDVEGTILQYLLSREEENKNSPTICSMYLDHYRAVFSYIHQGKVFFIHNIEWEDVITTRGLLAEYQRVNNYLERQLQMPNPTEIYILGPAANETFKESIKLETSINVNWINFTHNLISLEVKPLELASEYSFLVGLALREVE